VAGNSMSTTWLTVSTCAQERQAGGGGAAAGDRQQGQQLERKRRRARGSCRHQAGWAGRVNHNGRDSSWRKAGWTGRGEHCTAAAASGAEPEPPPRPRRRTHMAARQLQVLGNGQPGGRHALLRRAPQALALEPAARQHAVSTGTHPAGRRLAGRVGSEMGIPGACMPCAVLRAQCPPIDPLSPPPHIVSSNSQTPSPSSPPTPTPTPTPSQTHLFLSTTPPMT
jgi:hypothetical protein